MRLLAWGLFIVVAFLGFAFVRTRLRRARLARMSWEGLLHQLKPLPMEQITKIALDYLQPSKGQLELNTGDLWEMIGEADGLRRMYSNAEILVALASYAQHWNPLESIVVVERMRRDGVTLRRAALQLSVGPTLGYNTVKARFSVQEAASSYFLMRARVLALYETSHVGRLSKLQAAV